MKNRRNIIGAVFLLLFAILLVAPVVVTLAQDEPSDDEYVLTDQQFDSGSGEMSDDEYSVYGTAGLPHDGATMSDDEYSVEPIVLMPDPPANAYIQIKSLAFKFGNDWKGVVKEPLAGMYVEVYDETCADVAGYGNWGWNCNERKLFFDTIRANCDPINTAITDADGEALIGVYSVPGPHVVIALYEGEFDGVTYELYLAKRVLIDEVGVTKDVKLGVMSFTSRFVGKRRVLPLKGTTVHGSELIVFEPEYVVWEEGQIQEDFPFIAESAETWSLETSLYPPEGYVPDEETKSTYVDGTTETTVFEVTEVGSVMDYTRMEHDIKELRDGKVVKRVKLKHGIGTKSHGRPERFAPIRNKAGAKQGHGRKAGAEAIKIHEVFTGNEGGKPAKVE
jgi:hypothetical protein